jgi:hypothetical protein
MRRPALEIGVALVALGAVSLVEAWCLRNGWLGARLMPLVIGPKGLPASRDPGFRAFQNEKLAKYLPLATRMGIRK